MSTSGKPFALLLLFFTAAIHLHSVLASPVVGLACAECQTMVKMSGALNEIGNTLSALQGFCYASADSQRCWAELASTTRIDPSLCSRLQICKNPEDSFSAKPALTDCDWCTQAIEVIGATMQAGQPESARLVENLRDSCTQMPTHLIVQCQDSVTEQGPAMIDQLRSGNIPAQICLDAEFC